MGTISVVVILLVFTLIYGLLNYFVGKRVWDYLFRYVPGIKVALYWVCFALLASSFILAKLLDRFLPEQVSKVLSITGDYYMAVLFYGLLVFLVVEILLLIDKLVAIIPFRQHGHRWKVGSGLAICLLLGAIIGYGAWNAKTVKLTEYNLNIGKSAGEIKQLHVVMVSDIHLGLVVDRARLKNMVDKISTLKPDLVLLAGDTIDDDIRPFVDEQMGAELKRLKTRLGVYAIMGNHEYIGGSPEEFARQLENSGVTVLRDKYMKINDSFYLVGREDKSVERFGDRSGNRSGQMTGDRSGEQAGNEALGQRRKPLKELLVGMDKKLPVILLDHQPSNLQEPQVSGVDLQLSGHTHEGQLWPAHLITGRIFETDYGYLRKGTLQVIVSSGFGTWGPPIRVGNHPEIVELRLNFGPN